MADCRRACCEEHCRRCIDATCAGGSPGSGCPAVRCSACGVVTHGCKLTDHAYVCRERARPCPCAQYGCTQYCRAGEELAAHLPQCPAAPVQCYLCARLLLRSELGAHIEHAHREHEGTVFQHCPLRAAHGCGFYVVRQRPVGHSAALHAIAADTHGENLRHILSWRNRSQPAHLVEFTLGRTCPSPNKNLIVAWSSLSGVGVCDIRDHCDVYSRRRHGVNDGRTTLLELSGGLHGSLNPLPVPTILPQFRSQLAKNTVAARVGATTGLLSLPDEILRAVVCFVASDRHGRSAPVGAIPARRLGGCGDTLSVVSLSHSCRRLRRLCHQLKPPLLSLKWEPQDDEDEQEETGAEVSPVDELWQAPAMMSDEYCPSPKLLDTLQRLAAGDGADDTGCGSDAPMHVATELQQTAHAGADSASPRAATSGMEVMAMFQNGQPRGFRRVRRWRPSKDFVAVSRLGAPPPSLQWEMQVGKASPLVGQAHGSSTQSSVADECATIMAQHLQQCRVAAGCGSMSQCAPPPPLGSEPHGMGGGRYTGDLSLPPALSVLAYVRGAADQATPC